MVTVLIRTGNGLNAREHWRTRAKRVKSERNEVWACLRQASSIKPFDIQLPVAVKITRLGPSNGLDTDNLAGACKAVRDEIAAWLGVNDNDKRVQWHYSQRRCSTWSIEIEFGKPTAEVVFETLMNAF